MLTKTKNSVNIVIVDDEPIVRMDLKEILHCRNYCVVGEAGEGFEAIEVCKKKKPDLVLMDIKMPLLDGLSATQIIIEEKLAGIVMLLTSFSDDCFIEKATKFGVSGYLSKPFSAKNVIPAIAVALASNEMRKKIQNEKDSMADELEKRKLIERAKGLIMQKKSMTENEAYNFIRELSRKKNASMKRIAEIVLIQYGD